MNIKQFILPRKLITVVTVLASSFLILPVANASLLLQVDLSVENTISVTATDGASLATVTGGDFTGFLLADMFDGGQPGSNLLGVNGELVSGDLTSFADESDSSPSIFRAGGGSDTGLNIWTYTIGSTSTFVMGEQAFKGSATWTVNPDDYLAALGATGGNIYFAASGEASIPNASILGTWEVMQDVVNEVSTPATLGLVVLSLLVVLRRKAV